MCLYCSGRCGCCLRQKGRTLASAHPQSTSALDLDLVLTCRRCEQSVIGEGNLGVYIVASRGRFAMTISTQRQPFLAVLTAIACLEWRCTDPTKASIPNKFQLPNFVSTGGGLADTPKSMRWRSVGRFNQGRYRFQGQHLRSFIDAVNNRARGAATCVAPLAASDIGILIRQASF